MIAKRLMPNASKGVKRFFDWSHTPIESLGGAALIIGVAGIASRFLGFIRDRLLASSFGAGDILDAYFSAFRIPDFIYSLLVLGALSAAFIPVFTELLSQEKKEKAWQLTRDVLTLLGATLGVAALLGILFASPLAHFLAPGFNPEKQALVAKLTRIMLLSPLFLGLSAVFGGVIVSFKQFFSYSLAPILYNLGIIFGIIVLYPVIGPTGLAWGVVIGAILHMLIQYPGLSRSGFRYSLPRVLPWKDAALMRVITLMIPRSLAMAVNQVSLVVVTNFASVLASGSIAAFTLATNIEGVPLGLFGIAFSLAVFPVFSTLAAQKKHVELFETLVGTTHRILYFVIPLSIFLIIFRAETVRVVLGTGNFSWENTIVTFQILGLLTLSLFAQSLAPLFVRAFFALQDTRRPFYAALLSEVAHLALIPVLLPAYEVFGLAIAFSVGAIMNFAFLYFFLRAKLPKWDDLAFIKPATKILFAALVAGFAAQLSKGIFALAIDRLDTFIEVLTKLMIGFGIGGTVYVVLSAWLGFPEFNYVKRFVVEKLFRRPEALALTKDHPETGEW